MRDDSPHQDRRRFCRSLLLSGAALAARCGGPGGGWSPVEGAPGSALPGELDEAEHLYGLAPATGGDVAYQRDVVFVPSGARAVRALGADGMTWRLDRGAPGVEGIRAGQVLFATSRCAGRVLDVRREGDTAAVLLGPVEITDIVRECRIEGADEPLSLDAAVALAPADLPGATTEAAPFAPWNEHSDALEPYRLEEGSASHRGAPDQRWRLARYDGTRPGRLVHASANRAVHHFKAYPQSGPEGIGVRLGSHAGGVSLHLLARLRLQAPTLRPSLRISGGRVLEAGLRLTGAAGLKLGLVVAAEGMVAAKLNEPSHLVPSELRLPLFGVGAIAGLPLDACLQQRFTATGAFSTAGLLKAQGEWGLAGSYNFGFFNNHFMIGGPDLTRIDRGMLDSVEGFSLGPKGVVFGHQVRIMVGVGGFGFLTGPYLGCNARVGVSRGSDLARPLQPAVCRAVTLSLDAVAGIGYQLPQTLVDGINTLLRVVNLREITGSGGLQSSPSQFFTRTVYAPDTQLCREAAGGRPS